MKAIETVSIGVESKKLITQPGLQTIPRHVNICAVPTGFEPAISALTGQHVKPLHHGTN